MDSLVLGAGVIGFESLDDGAAARMDQDDTTLCCSYLWSSQLPRISWWRVRGPSISRGPPVGESVGDVDSRAPAVAQLDEKVDALVPEVIDEALGNVLRREVREDLGVEIAAPESLGP